MIVQAQFSHINMVNNYMFLAHPILCTFHLTPCTFHDRSKSSGCDSTVTTGAGH